MESKWPLMLIAFGLVFLLGLTISGLERKNVMKHWDKRRCEFAVMAAAGFFKEDDDSRSKTQFATDNFEFCMKSYVDKFMALLMAPISAMMSKQMDLTTGSMDMMNGLRQIAQTLYSELSKYVDMFYQRFNASVFEISRVVQYLRMAMRRITGTVMALLYSGITMFRGMINAIQFVIKVILIICAIMIAILIVLWFVLFPVIPLILSTLGAIVTTIFLLSAVISAQVADQANSSKKGFCFAKDTLVRVRCADGKECLREVQEIRVGDMLLSTHQEATDATDATDATAVTAVLEMDGLGVPLYDVEGILVSGSHLIKGTDGIWKSVCDDERARPVADTSNTLYCFNTTTHVIPVYSPCTRTAIPFRDWEEFSDEDEKGHYLWNYLILKLLNDHANYASWKDSLTVSTDVPLMSDTTKVKTTDGFVPLSQLRLGSKVLDGKGETQRVVGKVQGEASAHKKRIRGQWTTELFERDNGVWRKEQGTLVAGPDAVQGGNLITETGELVIWDDVENREKVIRDFTDIGYTTIHETYPLVASRLRIYE